MRHVILLFLTLFTSSVIFSQSVFINELHYDNTGADVDEGVEIAGPAGTDLSCYTLYLYNGSNGTVYDSLSLTGTIDNEGAGFGAVWFARAGIQNGAPDGVVLYDSCTASIVQFLSYEGTMIAANGVANGWLSTDIGVAETNSDPIGWSLQLLGVGTVYTDFTWFDSLAHTRDMINTGQFFQIPGANPAPCTEPFISEYIEGTSSNKALEIYNPTPAPLNLSNYRLELYTNGSTTASQVFQMDGMLAPGDVYVIANSNANAAIMAVRDTVSNVTFFNGDDAIALIKGVSDTIDVFGIIGNDPGTFWPVGGGGATAEFTLVRKASVKNGQLDPSVAYNEWDVFPQDFTDSLGTHTMTPCGVVTPPEFTFSPSFITVSEGAGSVDITVSLSQPADCSIDVALDIASTATEGLDFTYPNTQTLTFLASGPTTQVITIPIIDDALAEGDEIIEFNLQTTGGVGGCSIGSPSVLMVTISDNDYQYFPIIQIHDEDPNGLALSDGEKVELRGVVTYPNTRLNGLQFYIQDPTAGINVFSFSDQAGYSTVTLGDSIIVRGTLDQFNGLLEIIPDTILLASQGNTLPAHQVVDSLGEHVESELVELYGYTLVDALQWTNSGSGFNVDITNGTANLQIRIDNDVALFGTPAPTGVLIIRGVVSQYDNSSPYFEGYQVMPSSLTDIEEIMPPVAAFTHTVATPSITVTNTSTNATTYSWDFDDGTVVADQSPYTHTYAANGTYNVCITATNIAGSDTHCETVTITGIGIEEVLAENAVQIYPVPASKNITIRSDLHIERIELVNLAGQVIGTELGYRNGRIIIEVDDLAMGVYFMRIYTKDGMTVKKVIKN